MNRTNAEERVHRLLRTLFVFTLVAVLAGAIRMHPPAVVLQRCGDVLRFREALSMLVFAPLLVLLLWRLQVLAHDGSSAGLDAALFLLGACLIGVGMGMHDTCDLLGRVYARSAPPAVLHSLDFFDNRLGHYVFFAGFILTTFALGWTQTAHPLPEPLSLRTAGAFLTFSLVFAVVMVSNLIHERTARDVTVIAAAGLLVGVMQAVRRTPLRRAPLLLVLYPAYASAILIPTACWLLHGYPCP